MIRRRTRNHAIQRVGRTGVEVREGTCPQRECPIVRPAARSEADGSAADSGAAVVVKLAAAESEGAAVDVDYAVGVVVHDDAGERERAGAVGLGQGAVVVEDWSRTRAGPGVGEIAIERQGAVVIDGGPVLGGDARAAPGGRAVVIQGAPRSNVVAHPFGRRAGDRERAANGNRRHVAERVRVQRAADPVEIGDGAVRPAEFAIRQVVIVDARRGV